MSAVVDTNNTWNKEKQLPRNHRPLLVGMTPYGSHTLTWWFAETLLQCPYKCDFSENKSLIATADVLVYYGARLLKSQLSQVRMGQHRLLFMKESPGRGNNFYNDWTNISAGYFDITLTYLRESDYSAAYNTFERIENASDPRWTDEEVSKALAAKSQGSFYLASNLHAPSRRDEVVTELAKYHPVGRYGRYTQECDKNCEEKLIASSHFYLALENTVCKDYITEKFYRFKKLVVPITLKRSVLSGIVPGDVFIAVDDFCSVKQLADYLNWLMKNPQEYKRYFSWTKTHRKDNRSSNSKCDLCRDLHLGTVRTTDRSKLKDLWDIMPKSVCEGDFGNKMVKDRCSGNFTSGNPLLIHYTNNSLVE